MHSMQQYHAELCNLNHQHSLAKVVQFPYRFILCNLSPGKCDGPYSRLSVNWTLKAVLVFTSWITPCPPTVLVNIKHPGIARAVCPKEV